MKCVEVISILIASAIPSPSPSDDDEGPYMKQTQNIKQSTAC